MNVLAFDTCFGACSVAIVRQEQDSGVTLADEQRIMSRGHAEVLLPMIEHALETASVTLQQIDRIAVTIGPGTFTGVRVAIAAARALTLATKIPLIGIGTLEAAAQTALTQHDVRQGPFAMIRDARRDQVYLQSFDVQNGDAVPTMLEPIICDPADAMAKMPAAVETAIGSGASLVPWPDTCAPRLIEADVDVSGTVLAKLAFGRELIATPLSPLYLRAPDAKPQTGFALQRQAAGE